MGTIEKIKTDDEDLITLTFDPTEDDSLVASAKISFFYMSKIARAGHIEYEHDKRRPCIVLFKDSREDRIEYELTHETLHHVLSNLEDFLCARKLDFCLNKEEWMNILW